MGEDKFYIVNEKSLPEIFKKVIEVKENIVILHIRWSFGKTCISHLSCAYIMMCKNIKNMAIKQIYLAYFIKRT